MRAKLVLTSIALISAAVVAGCQGGKGLQVGNIDVGALTQNISGLKPITEPEEIQMGKGMTETLLGASPLTDDAQLQIYVNNVGRWVAQQSERPNLPWHFAVNDSDAINAVAAPGGDVIVTKGMLRVLRNESELAGVLGHEVAHVVRKHQLTAIQKGAFMGLLTQTVQVTSSGRQSEQLVNALIGPTKELYLRGLDKSDEYEADRMGVVIAARAGYDAWGLPNSIQTLGTIKPDDNAVALLFKTHPTPASRLEKLSVAMGTSFDVYASGQQNTERYQHAIQGIRVAAQK
jgi:predicted Zn-dependent protease